MMFQKNVIRVLRRILKAIQCTVFNALLQELGKLETGTDKLRPADDYVSEVVKDAKLTPM